MGRTVSRWEASAGTWAGWQCILTGRLGVGGAGRVLPGLDGSCW